MVTPVGLRSVIAAISGVGKRISVTNHGWMMPYAMLGMTKIPEEQGVWSAQAALAKSLPNDPCVVFSLIGQMRSFSPSFSVAAARSAAARNGRNKYKV